MQTLSDSPLTGAEYETLNAMAKSCDLEVSVFETLLRYPKEARKWMGQMEARAQAEYDRQREEDPNA